MTGAALVLEVADRLCAVPLAHVVETMRPLPVEPLAGAPDFVAGVAAIRGRPTPVVDLHALLRATRARTRRRYLRVRVGEDRFVALAIDGVLGVKAEPELELGAAPPLLEEAAGEAVSAIGRLDGALVTLLRVTRLLPAAAWDALEGRG